MFRERGFADTGMRDIAEAADLSAANLYHYFRGKDEILFYCQDRALDRMLAAVARRPGRGTRPRARLHAVLTRARAHAAGRGRGRDARTSRSNRSRRRCASGSCASAIATSTPCAG